MRKPPFLALVLLISASVITACSSGDSRVAASVSPTVAIQEPVSTKEATAPKKPEKKTTISIQAPEGWTENDDESSLIWYEKDMNYFNLVMPWIPADIGEAPVLAEYAREQILNHFQEAQVSEVQTVYLGSVEAARIDLSIPVDEQLSQKQVQVFFFIDGTPYQITGVYFDNDAQIALDIEAMIMSLKVGQTAG